MGKDMYSVNAQSNKYLLACLHTLFTVYKDSSWNLKVQNLGSFTKWCLRLPTLIKESNTFIKFIVKPERNQHKYNIYINITFHRYFILNELTQLPIVRFCSNWLTVSYQRTQDCWKKLSTNRATDHVDEFLKKNLCPRLLRNKVTLFLFYLFDSNDIHPIAKVLQRAAIKLHWIHVI